jgi:hypothetical protein
MLNLSVVPMQDPTTKKLNIVLQINERAKSPALRDWARKKSTHGKLAIEVFDTAAQGKTAELDTALWLSRG